MRLGEDEGAENRRERRQGKGRKVRGRKGVNIRETEENGMEGRRKVNS